MLRKKIIRMQFPKDDSNEIFDGRVHTIIPISLESVIIGNRRFYVLNYRENKQYGITLLGINKDKQFFKIPLDNYDCLYEYLENNQSKSETIDMLNQIFIDTVDIKDSEYLFSTGILRRKPELAIGLATGSEGEPPKDPYFPNSGGEPPKDPYFPNSGGESPTVAMPALPPKPPKPQRRTSELPKTDVTTLYVGFYGTEYAKFMGLKREDIANKIRFGRDMYDKKLDSYILSILRLTIEGYIKMKDTIIDIDYGKHGEGIHMIDTDLYDECYIDEEEYYRKYGEYKYKIHFYEFTDLEDFKKLQSSRIVECTFPDNSPVKPSYPISHASAFLALSTSSISAKFYDSYGHSAFNNFKRKDIEGGDR